MPEHESTFTPVVPMRMIPASDAAFVRAARRLATGAISAGELQRRLRALYPRAIVRERDLSNEPRALYVYRDGHYQLDPEERSARRDW